MDFAIMEDDVMKDKVSNALYALRKCVYANSASLTNKEYKKILAYIKAIDKVLSK